MRRRRALVLGVVVVVLAGLLVAGRGDSALDRPSVGRTRAFPASAVASGELAQTWYCAGGSANGSGDDVTYILTNVGTTDRVAALSMVVDSGPLVTATVAVPAGSTVATPASSIASSATAGAIVEIDGGDVAVEHALGGIRAAPCASGTSDRWYSANGSTTPGATELVYVLNPFPEPAVVTITAATEGGLDTPRSLEALPVRAQSVVVVDLGQHVLRRQVAAVTVDARAGHVVVDRIQRFDGSDGRVGSELSLAAPATSTTWQFPDAGVEAGSTSSESWHIFAPDGATEVSLEPVPDGGGSLNPVTVPLGSGGQGVVTAAELGITAGQGYSMTVRSLDGEGVVVEREVDGRDDGRRGWSSALGAPEAGSRWVLAAGESSATTLESISVLNVGADPVTVRFSQVTSAGLVPLPGLEAVDLAASQRTRRDLGAVLLASPLAVVVEADGEVVVARRISQPGSTGVSDTAGLRWPTG